MRRARAEAAGALSCAPLRLLQPQAAGAPPSPSKVHKNGHKGTQAWPPPRPPARATPLDMRRAGSLRPPPFPRTAATDRAHATRTTLRGRDMVKKKGGRAQPAREKQSASLALSLVGHDVVVRGPPKQKTALGPLCFCAAFLLFFCGLHVAARLHSRPPRPKNGGRGRHNKRLCGCVVFPPPSPPSSPPPWPPTNAHKLTRARLSDR